MAEADQKISELEARLDSLVRTQIDFQVEISAIRKELTRLRNLAPGAYQSSKKEVTAETPPQPKPRQHPTPPATHKIPTPVTTAMPPPEFAVGAKGRGNGAAATNRLTQRFDDYVDNARNDLEKFIGENLISKIGIIVLILGVGIGAKYAIDNDLISPLTRIILGYIIGLGVAGIALRLKSKYHNFSAVLASGGFAILYFITYFAYSAYALIPHPAALLAMALLTIVSVAAAIWYDRQVIAHIGLVGAYAVPFLLSNNSGNYLFLFVYMAILNTGILAISISKAWRPIFYTASAFTWFIFFAWAVSKYSPEEHFYLGLIFAGIFFSIFYVVGITYGVVHSQLDQGENIVPTILTGLIFYAFVAGLGNASVSTAKYAFLFALLAFFALTVLITSYRFYGRLLVFVAYPCSWLIFSLWFLTHYDAGEHFALAATSASMLFGIFYGATLLYRTLTDELGMAENTGLVLTNSFIYYGFGYAIIDSRPELRAFQGLVTAAHAVFHLLIAQTISRLKENIVDVVRTLTVLVITFATIAIPIQLDGNHVTLAWSVEAAVLFYFGRIREVRVFEWLSYPVMAIAAMSLVVDWFNIYQDRIGRDLALVRRPFINGDLITALVCVAAAAFIFAVNRASEDDESRDRATLKLFGRVVAVAGLFALHNALRIEIDNFFFLESVNRDLPYGMSLISGFHDLECLSLVAQLDFTLLFLVLLGVVNLQKVRSVFAGVANCGLGVVMLAATATFGMILLYALRLSYVDETAIGLFGSTFVNVLARPVTYGLCAALLVLLFAYSRSELLDASTERTSRVWAFDAVLYLFVFIVASCELMNLAGQLRLVNADRYGLSILWGIYALVVVATGIATSKKHLRIGAMVVLGFTLAKLFFYDIVDLGTIPKTLLFVCLGMLLLLISFLYNKYKDLIFGTETRSENKSM